MERYQENIIQSGSGHDVFYYDNFITSQLAVIRLQGGRGRAMEGMMEAERPGGGRGSDNEREGGSEDG